MKPWLSKVNRFEPSLLDRSKFLRLDKNERVINFEKKFLNFLKKKLKLIIKIFLFLLVPIYH